MQDAGTVLEVLRERGRKGLPCDELYRQMFNKSLYLLAYGNIYSNQGAMTPGASDETADGMSEAKIEQIIALMRAERYRFAPVRRVLIPKKNGKLRPLGLPSWSDKLAGEVVRLLLEAYYEPQFSDRSHGFRKGRGCHTALREIQQTWTGTVWFIEGDDARLVLFEGQPSGHQPRGEPRLDLFGFLPGVAEGGQVIGVSDQHRAARRRHGGIAAGVLVADPGGVLHPVQGHVQQAWADHAPNAMDNFCFDVTLGYRRLERPRRATGAS